MLLDVALLISVVRGVDDRQLEKRLAKRLREEGHVGKAEALLGLERFLGLGT
jgi:hypothetical protein